MQLIRLLLKHITNITIVIHMQNTMKRRVHMTETFESSVHEEGAHRFLMDRTLYKGIKDNDVAKIIDLSNDNGALEQRLLPDEAEQLSHIVAEMRRKYDEVRTETKRLEAELDKSRRHSEALREEEAQLKGHISSARKNLEEKESEQNAFNEAVEARVYDLDIYREMEARLKQDILIARKRNFDKDVALKKDNVKLRTLRQEEFNKTKISYRCRDMLESIEKSVVGKQVERTTKINSLYEAVNRRHDNVRKREEREREIEEVMMRAMSEKLQEEKECINICFANLFLKKFLKNKMERLIADNETVESAYHKIRSNTDVRDSKELITRFLNREKDYGQLLERIAEKENFLEELKSDRDTLEHDNHLLTQQEEELHENAIQQGGNFADIEKQLEQLEQKLKDIKYKQNLMKRWSVRFHCAFASQTREQVLLKYQARPLQDLLQDVLSEIHKYTDHLLGDENSSASINQAFLQTKPTPKVFNDDMLIRNNRVRTAMIEDSVVDGEDGLYDGASEADYLQHNRRAIKKNEQTRRFRIKTQAK